MPPPCLFDVVDDRAPMATAEVADRSTPSADKPEPEPAKPTPPNVMSAVEAARERRRKAKADA